MPPRWSAWCWNLREVFRWRMDEDGQSKLHASLYPSKAAWAMWDKLYKTELFPSMATEESELFERFDTKVWKYAGMYALQDHTLEMTEEHLESGLIVSRYLKDTALHMAPDIGASEKVRTLNYVEGRIRKAGRSGMTWRKLSTGITESRRAAVKQYGLGKLVGQLIDDGDVFEVGADGETLVHRDSFDEEVDA